MQMVQDKILEIAIYLDDFCQEHNITYYLMGGSALGAIRHGGFIPWDDDLDVFMTYDNYVKFISACEKHLDTERFYLQKENTEEWPLLFTKLRMNNTTYIEEDTKDRKMHKGFYVDIMCLNNTSKNLVFRYLQYLSARLITAKTLAERGYMTKSRLKKLSMFLAKHLIRGSIFSGLLRVVRCLNGRNTEYVGHFLVGLTFLGLLFHSHISKPRYVDFSTTRLPVPQEAEKYLEVRFGPNYMDMPDRTVRDEYPIHAIFVDVSNSFELYEGEC